MSFVQVGMLGALGALVIPIIIHLMFRQRSRPVDLGTLQFLKVVLRDSARRRKLRRWLLMALRMACVALIALVFARPYLTASEAAGGDRLAIVLVDRSASMGLRGGKRPIAQAAAAARGIVVAEGRGTEIELATFDRETRPVKNVADFDKTLEPAAAGTNYGAAMAWARDRCVRSQKAGKVVHVITDFQRAGLDRGESVKLPADVDVRLVDVGRDFPRNVAVTSVMSAPATIRPGDAVRIIATIDNASARTARQVPVNLRIELGGETKTLNQTIDLDIGATATVEFAVPALAEGIWRGHVAVAADDDLPVDDRRYFAVDVSPPIRVLLVDGEPGRSRLESETFFLEAALRLAPAGQRFAKSPFDPRSIALAGDVGLPDLSKTDVVVLANVERVERQDLFRLKSFVARGGGLMVFTGSHVEGNAARALADAGLGVGTMVGIETDKMNPWRLDSWEVEHPIFRLFRNPEHGDLRRPAFREITQIQADPKARIVARFRGGAPALVEAEPERGRILWFASACDRDWSDWPRSRLFVPMIHQMMTYLAGRPAGGRVRQDLADDAHAPGFFDAGGVVHVVNVDPFESETARCTLKEFADRFGFRLNGPARPAFQSAVAPPSGADGPMRSDELWPWLALALFGGLLLENFLANRTAA
jgi:hypothetical protein